jgi:hypothetical protein
MSTRRTLQKSSPDFELQGHGSLYLLRPLNAAATDWMNEHLPVDSDETQFWGTAIVIESRFVAPIMDGIIADGLAVRS